MAISGLVIAYNEERHIEDCVKSLFRVCDEVIIIDSYSKDNTVKIAERLNAKVYFQDFLGDGLQRVHGLQYCKNEWILNLDADERLDEDTYAFLKSKAYLDDDYDAYNLRMRNFLGTEEIDFSGWYPDYTCRFFNKNTAKPSASKVHQRIEAKNLVNTKLHLYHYGWDSFYQIIAKKNQYTDWQAEQMLTTRGKVSSFAPLTHGFASFVKGYFLEKGIFNGLDGFTFSLIQAFFSYMKYAKLRKLQKTKSQNK